MAPEREICLLTVSGGVDSVVLAHLFHIMGWRAGIAHCNFGLRGEESDGDEKFVKDLAARYGFDFYSKSFDAKYFAKQHSVSTQMAARELRYPWFEEIRNANGYHWIATAHHANDSLETVLLNLVRGTGLPGMTGILGKYNFLIRPLLLASKEEILAYAAEHGLEWREDRSNDTDDYKRNLIRHKVIPVFQQLNPSLEATFNATSERLRSGNNLLNEFLEQWRAATVITNQDDIRINKQLLYSCNEPAYRLWHVLQGYGFSYQQAKQVFASLDAISGKIFFSNSHILLIDRLELVIRARSGGQTDDELAIPYSEGEFSFGDLTINLVNRGKDHNSQTGNEKSVILLDVAKLEFPLKIRRWKQGDIFAPIGMKGKRKKLSDLFIDLKMNRFEKERASVLLNGNGEIIWVIGVRSDERYRVGDLAGQLISISISNKI
ncbi:tRNA lysidine(34) synthetase TilS [Dyadobacter pollutisoli]|uniref:tRNA(Ile)-lysidine synthase n=1 Tax=Dyadobacter pollutisoli TaxID=2910158 RepID=A0A9E8SM41_9BACT|nr:tRNA lysidine(34) synthetase TilS [Dyadobacter pollutisoli]WAC12391.1 tRNA lysidine(34) synthetase TilS [Dyadobacter pollutisoli]